MDIETLTRSQERSLWSIHKAESGQTYYYNLKSGSSQWDKPACFAEQGEEGQEEEWMQYFTAEGKSYWYNSKTKESKWQKPETEEKHVVQQHHAHLEDDSGDDAPPDPVKEFHQLLHEQQIPVTMKWDQAVKNLQNDYRWKGIGSISDKKRLFNQYMDELKKVEKDEQKVRLTYAKEEFFKMLEEFKINNSDKKFWQVASALVNDPRWKAIPEEKERENLFQDHLDKLYVQERENMKVSRKVSIEDFAKKLQRYIDSKMIDHTTSWDLCLKLFSQDRLLQTMQPVDALGVFEEVVNPLYEQWRQMVRQKFRNNRIAYREMLQLSMSEGMLSHKTKWRDYVQTLIQEPRFINMIGQPGSQPHELFQDFMQTIRQNHQVYKSELKIYLKQKGVKSLENVTFEQFNNIFTGNEVWAKMAEYEQKYYYRYFQENIRAKDNNSGGPKRFKKMAKRFTKMLKSIATINAQSSYDQFESLLSSKISTELPKLLQLSDDHRRQTFDSYVKTLVDAQQGNESISDKKKKKKKKNKKRKEESQSEESNSDKRRPPELEPEIEPKVEKLAKKNPPAPAQMEAEDGEIPEAAENVLQFPSLNQEEAGEYVQEEAEKVSPSKSKKKAKSRGKHKHKRDDYEKRHEKTEKHHKKSKKHYK